MTRPVADGLANITASADIDICELTERRCSASTTSSVVKRGMGVSECVGRGRVATCAIEQNRLELVPTHSELGLRYRSDLFDSQSAKRFLVQTKSYVDAMLVEGNALAVDHLVIEDDDYLSTVVTPNETRQPWPEAACVHELMFLLCHKSRQTSITSTRIVVP